MLDRREFIGRSCGAVAGVSLSVAHVQRAHARELMPFRLQADWLIGNGRIGDIAAKSLGYFKEEGLDVIIAPGGPNNNGVANVASGQAMVGNMSSSPSLMLARAGGIPVKAFAAAFQQHPFSFFSLPSKPVREPNDLRGKKVGLPQVSVVLLRALLKKHQIPENEVQVVPIGAEVTPLLTGQVDVVTAWYTDSNRLKPLGEDRIMMKLWDCGVRLYGGSYYTTDETVAQHAEKLAAFVRASARGWRYVKEHPEKAVELFVKSYPAHDVTTEEAAIGAVLSAVFRPSTELDGWGTMDPQIWADQISMYESLGQFAGRAVPRTEDLVTTSILDVTRAQRAV